MTVNTSSGTYPIIIEHGATARLGEIARAHAPGAQAALLAIDDAISDTHGQGAFDALRRNDLAVTQHALRASEQQKTLDAARRIYEVMLSARLDRSGLVIAMGGGIVGDVAGFAAATYLRGVRLIQAPTTLLAMVDASIGGKTGVNFPLPGDSQAGQRDPLHQHNQLGKNLIGAFWPPIVVVIDPQVLQTLPARHLRCGIAESIKHGVIADPVLLELIEREADAILSLEDAPLLELLERSIAVKAHIVGQDEREAGTRALLNLGHTFAHAIEAHHDLGLLHGEAVAVGLRCAAHAAVQMRRLDPADADHIKRVIERVGLPTSLGPLSSEGRANVDSLMHAMTFDKKTQHGRLRLVLPTTIGEAAVCDGVPEQVIRDAWRAVGAG